MDTVTDEYTNTYDAVEETVMKHCLLLSDLKVDSTMPNVHSFFYGQ